MDIDITAVAALLMAIGSLVGVFVTLRRVRAEIAVERVRVDADVSQEIIRQAQEWLRHQGDYVQNLTVEVADLRAQIRILKEDQERREENYRQYIRYLLHNIGALTEQVCELGYRPAFTPMTYEKFVEEL